MTEPIVEPQTPAVAPAEPQEGPPQIEGLELQTPQDPAMTVQPTEIQLLQKANAGLIKDLQRDRIKHQEQAATFEKQLKEINESINQGRPADDPDPMPDPEENAAEFLKWSHRNLGEQIAAGDEKRDAEAAATKGRQDLEADFAKIRVEEQEYITTHGINPEDYAGKIQAVRNLRMQMHMAAGANAQEAQQAVAIEEFNLIKRARAAGESIPQMAMAMYDQLAAGAAAAPAAAEPTPTLVGPAPAAVIAATNAGRVARSPVAEAGAGASPGVLTNASLANLNSDDYNKMVTYLKSGNGDRWRILQTTGSVQL